MIFHGCIDLFSLLQLSALMNKTAVYNSFFGANVLNVINYPAYNPGEGNGTPLQYSCLENPVDTGAW